MNVDQIIVFTVLVMKERIHNGVEILAKPKVIVVEKMMIVIGRMIITLVMQNLLTMMATYLGDEIKIQVRRALGWVL